MDRNVNTIRGGLQVMYRAATGVLGSLIPASGADGPSIMYPQLRAGDGGHEWSYWVQDAGSMPAGFWPLDDYGTGTRGPYADGSYGPSTVALYRYDELQFTFPVTLTVGVATDTTRPTLSGSIGLTNLSTTSYTVTCPQGTDNVGVTQYRWRINAGSWTVIALGGRVANITGRTPGATDQLEMACGDAAGLWSDPLSLDVDVPSSTQAPVITLQPLPRVVAAGQAAEFKVEAAGAAPITVQWQRDGNTIPGATAVTLLLQGVSIDDSGSVFSAVASNAYGSASSSGALLTVLGALEMYTLRAPQDQLSHLGGFAPKDPAAVTWLVFDFRRYTGECLNPVVTVTRQDGAADDAPQAIKSGNPVAGGTLVFQRVQGGVDHCDYLVRCEVDAPGGGKYPMAGILPVRAIP
jgi:hypothetical protein